MYNTSTLSYSPKEYGIKQLLLECIEMHYGKIPLELKVESKAESLINELKVLVDKYEQRH